MFYARRGLECVAPEAAGHVQNDLPAALLDKRDEVLRDVCGPCDVGEEGLMEGVHVHVVSCIWSAGTLDAWAWRDRQLPQRAWTKYLGTRDSRLQHC